MPIVFVHGVNNRLNEEFRDNEKARNGFLTQVVGPPLGVDPAKVRIFSPYWGDAGVTRAWGGASLPSKRGEAFGGESDLVKDRVGFLVRSSGLTEEGLVARAKENFGATVDLLMGAAMAGDLKDQGEAAGLARLSLAAAHYASKNSAPAWLANVNDANFVDVLLTEIADDSGDESFGVADWLSQLKEAVLRLKSLPGATATDLGFTFVRKDINANASLFLGDAFKYLMLRQNQAPMDEISKIVSDALHEADAARTAEDNKLIVIAHSFGGEITYDLFTTFDKALQVDAWVTVGSQVALFEEMKLFRVSANDVPPNPPKGKVAKPPQVARWLNVYDLNDPFGYVAEPVFDGVKDWHYDTGYVAPVSHGGYFLRPSFYRRLAARLTEA